ncbi:hypothetical protein ACLMJK_002399 [Lecanora helva]
MDKAKNIARGGWHPQGKNGGKESWRGDNKGINQVAGWIGKGKTTEPAASEHRSRPLASLRDPDAFGPPPKNVNYHGGTAVPNAITPDRRGLGAPMDTEESQAKKAEQRRQEEEAANKPTSPPVPYRVNTTGINTRNLPKPPVRRLEQEDETQTPSPASTKSKPSLPPRLPPRQNSRPDIHTPDPPPTYTAATQKQPSEQEGYLNAGALNRLGKSGVSVPGFGIGSAAKDNNSEANPWASQSTNPASRTTSPSPAQNSSLGGLQSRFSKLSTNSSPPSDQGTTMQQKQDALRTASAFHKDPSSVSLADARSTASTANNFRERHGEQVAAGGRWAGAVNKKYDIAGKVNGLGGGNPSDSNPQVQSPPLTASGTSPWANEPSAGSGPLSPTGNAQPTSPRDGVQSPMTAFSRKAPPPPPQARKPGPPPVPLGSKPKG